MPGSDLLARMRERRPLVAWAALMLLGASAVFVVGAPLWAYVTKEDRTGPDPYGPQDLAVLRQDPLMQMATDGVVPRGEGREVISEYICAFCDFFPTGILRGYNVLEEPSSALNTIERVAESTGWTTVERGCTTDPPAATLVVEKNFEEFHTSTLYRLTVGEQKAGIHSRATITHDHKRIRADDLGDVDCLDERWRNLPPVPANP